MSDLNIIRIDNAVEVTYGLYIAVISILSGTDTYQCIPRLNHIAHRLGLLLGLDFGDGRPLGRNILGIGIFLSIRVQRFLARVIRLRQFLWTRVLCGFLWNRATRRLSQKILPGL